MSTTEVLRRTDFQKANTYTGQKLKGLVEFNIKIDGVRILERDGKFVTRNNKVPPGLDRALTNTAKNKLALYKDCEVYYQRSFLKTNGILSQHEPEPDCIKEEHIYPLPNGMEPRLKLGEVLNPTKEFIMRKMKKVVGFGYEGLILRVNGRWYRVKPDYTADVRITGWFEQKDKHGNLKGQLGGFTTNYGKVTAFTEKLRVMLWDNPDQYVGQLMEVIYKELYHTGKFRYCVTFSRFRTDKDEESFDTKNI